MLRNFPQPKSDLAFSHQSETGGKFLTFLKPTTSLIWPEDEIIYPEMSKRVDYEGELALLIKKKAKNIKEKDARKYVEGFTCCNDVTARDLQKIDGQWTRSKSFDTFCAVGPRIVKWNKNFNPNNLKIQTFLNGKIVQDSNTSDFIFKVEEIVSFMSRTDPALMSEISLDF